MFCRCIFLSVRRNSSVVVKFVVLIMSNQTPVVLALVVVLFFSKNQSDRQIDNVELVDFFGFFVKRRIAISSARILLNACVEQWAARDVAYFVCKCGYLNQNLSGCSMSTDFGKVDVPVPVV